MPQYSHPKYTIEDIKKKYKSYVSAQEKKQLPLEISGLCSALDISKSDFKSWLNYDPDNSDPDNSNNNINKDDAKTYKQLRELCKKIMEDISSSIMEYGLQNPKSQAMAIFLLKQQLNGGYSDKQEFTTSGNVNLTVKLTDSQGTNIK